jgi:hypothetical protein
MRICNHNQRREALASRLAKKLEPGVNLLDSFCSDIYESDFNTNTQGTAAKYVITTEKLNIKRIKVAGMVRLKQQRV